MLTTVLALLIIDKVDRKKLELKNSTNTIRHESK